MVSVGLQITIWSLASVSRSITIPYKNIFVLVTAFSHLDESSLQNHQSHLNQVSMSLIQVSVTIRSLGFKSPKSVISLINAENEGVVIGKFLIKFVSSVIYFKYDVIISNVSELHSFRRKNEKHLLGLHAIMNKNTSTSYKRP